MKTFWGLGLLSAALIGYQVTLMQILSYTQWDHFAYMILAIAMLGFGAAGTLLSLYRNELLARYKALLPWLAIATSIFMILILTLGQLEGVRFDSYLVFIDPGHLRNLVINYLLFMMPFFTGALAIGLILVKKAARISKYYAINLIGSGLGAVVIPLLADHFAIETLSRAIALATALSGFLFLRDPGSSLWRSMMVILFLVAIPSIFVLPIRISPSQFKDISRVMNLPDAQLEFEQPSSHGIVQALESNHLKYGPALSLHHIGEIPASHAVFENGNGRGLLHAGDSSNTLSSSLFHLPWQFANYQRVLMIHPGTAPMAGHAMNHGAHEITLVIPNPALGKALNSFQLVDKPLARSNNIQMVHQQPRVFLAGEHDLFDLAVLPAPNRLGGDNGVNALRPDYTLTEEGLTALWSNLDTTGVISINCWLDYPPKHSLRLLTTFLSFLGSIGIEKPEAHVLGIRNWSAAAFLVRKTPFADEDIQNIRKFCSLKGFDPLVLGGRLLETEEVFNQLQDNLLPLAVAQILNDPDGGWVRQYPLKIGPVTDDRPFFGQFAEVTSFRLGLDFSNGIGTEEVGLQLIWLSLVQVLVLAAIFIVVPLIPARRTWSRKTWTLIYFSGLGAGFMLVEILFINKISFYLGDPILAAGITIGALLVWSGLGSYLSPIVVISDQRWAQVMLTLCGLLMVYGFLLDAMSPFIVTLGEATKLIMTWIMVAPIGMALGLPFASGIAFLDRKDPGAVPWAWGINGCFSVLAPIIATLLSLQYGFLSLMWAAFVAYLASTMSIFPRLLSSRSS